ncbi:hypothetical protein NDI52_33120 [Leptolyngbya sp. PL-A3]|uniref:hypothetical protein n=1 Tax=Leptolyngbya sp. PL-A3 TaxID=2933911 RepID=UPI0032997582
MSKILDFVGVPATFTASEPENTLTPEQSYDPSYEPPANDAANEFEDGCEQESLGCEQPESALTDVDDLLAIEIWKPTEPQYCRAICAHYGVKSRTVQKWFTRILEVCPWFSEAELRLPDDRYTPLCIELMGDYRASGLIARKWGERMAERFADRIAAAKPPATAPQTIDPDVLPPESEPGTGGDRQSPTRPLLPQGRNYLAAPEEEEAELNNLQTQELQLLGQMHQGLSRLNHASEQWNRANQLRRQRLIKQTRLEAASLAIELEEEFETTLHEVQYRLQRGDLSTPEPTPGKPPAAPGRSPSA